MYKYVNRPRRKEGQKFFRSQERPPFPYHPVKTHKWYVDKMKEMDRIEDLAAEIFYSKFDDED